ncbi:MAG: amidohydrolase family protein, partial [Casimicrobium sp.]
VAFYFLREKQLPPIQKLRDAGVPLALATDHNPGSSPTLSPALVMNMACTLFRMTPLEAWRGFTVNAARALGMPSDAASFDQNARATFAIWAMDHPRDLCYSMGGASPLSSLVICGEVKASAQGVLK